MGLYRGVKRRLRQGYQSEKVTPSFDIKDGLLLLNLMRNESHRWAIETALAVLNGDEEDHRTPQIQAEISELLAWAEA